MNEEITYSVMEINVGFHPEGFRIDKTAEAMKRYTKWTINSKQIWENPEAVCFHSLPEIGWIKADSFDWSGVEL